MRVDFHKIKDLDMFLHRITNLSDESSFSRSVSLKKKKGVARVRHDALLFRQRELYFLLQKKTPS